MRKTPREVGADVYTARHRCGNSVAIVARSVEGRPMRRHGNPPIRYDATLLASRDHKGLALVDIVIRIDDLGEA
ncbi:MAG: hypothetical protein AAF526_10405, partial [Pseudomonadota bacterium]